MSSSVPPFNSSFNSSTVELAGDRLLIRLMNVDFGRPSWIIKVECDRSAAEELRAQLNRALGKS